MEADQSPKSKFDWQTAVKRKQQEIISKTPKQWILGRDFIQSLNCGPDKSTNILKLNVPRISGILTEKELDITEKYTAMELLEKLRNKDFTSLEITTAFCKRAAIAQQLVSSPSWVCQCNVLILPSTAVMYNRGVVCRCS